MAVINLTVSPAIGMSADYTAFDLRIEQTEYDDKEVYKSLGLLWNPQDKLWHQSGYIKGNNDETKTEVLRKVVTQLIDADVSFQVWLEDEVEKAKYEKNKEEK